MDLKIYNEFKNLILPLNPEEFKGLKESILNGYDNTFPIVIWDGTVIDGHNRYCRGYSKMAVHGIIGLFM